jgi:predicted nucleic acid-binding protein
MGTCYFDTSVFLAILNGEQTAKSIRVLLRELKQEKTRIYTSIITVQEASVQVFRAGGRADEMHAQIAKLARIQTITREISLTAARLEAEIIRNMRPNELTEEERIGQNRRRKWDCFHIATALELGCTHLYTLDQKMINRQTQLNLSSPAILHPTPRRASLFPDPPQSGLVN